MLINTIAAIELYLKHASAARDQVLDFDCISADIFNDFIKIRTMRNIVAH